MTHTPGPWRAEGEDVFSGHTCQATHIANANPIRDMFRSTAAANARLIAAAPELLQAGADAADLLIACFGSVSDPSNVMLWSDEGAYAAYWALHYAIAKTEA